MKRIIFAVGNGITRAPFAAQIFKAMYPYSDAEVLCRGVVVAFPEPLNQKAEAVLISNNLLPEGFSATQLTDEDINADTLIFTMEERQRRQIIARVESADEDNTFVISTYIGDELEILDPYGGALQTYGLCFEVIRASIEKLIAKLHGEGALINEAVILPPVAKIDPLNDNDKKEE